MVLQGSNHTTRPMARFAFRVTTASALSLAILTAVPPAPSTAQAQETERPFGLLDRIFSGSERFGGGSERGASPSAADQTAQMSGSDLVVRLERLESQIRQLTGAIEQLQFRNQQLEAQVRRLQEGARPVAYSRVRPVRPCRRVRLQRPRPDGAATPSIPRRIRRRPVRRIRSARSTHRPASRTRPPIRTTRRSLLRADAWPMRRSILPIWASRRCDAGTAAAWRRRRRPPLPPSQTPRDEYDLAYGYVLRKDYALAEDGFRNFLSKYPDDRLAGDATFWLGESQFQRQRYRDAAEAFLNVSTKYDRTPRRPMRCSASDNRSPCSAKRRPARRSARCCANFRAPPRA